MIRSTQAKHFRLELYSSLSVFISGYLGARRVASTRARLTPDAVIRPVIRLTIWITGLRLSAPQPGKVTITLNLRMIFQISPDRDVTTLSVQWCLK